MKYLTVLILTCMLFASPTFAIEKEITEYDAYDAIHPFKIASLIIRPPIAIIDVFIKGFYYVLDSDPIRRPFNIDYTYSVGIDEDY